MKIIKKKFVIDSTFIQSDILTFSENSKSNFTYFLSNAIKNVKKISLTDIILPINFNNFSKVRNNNIVRLREFIWSSYISNVEIVSIKKLKLTCYIDLKYSDNDKKIFYKNENILKNDDFKKRFVSDFSSFWKGLVFNYVYKITKINIDNLTFIADDNNVYKLEITLTYLKSKDIFHTIGGDIDIINPKLKLDKYFLGKTLSFYVDKIITIPDGSYNLTKILNTLDLKLSNTLFNYSNLLDSDKSVERSYHKYSVFDQSGYYKMYVEPFDEKPIYRDFIPTVLIPKHRGIIPDAISNIVKFVFRSNSYLYEQNGPDSFFIPKTLKDKYKNLYGNDLNTGHPLFRKYCLIKHGDDMPYDLLYYLGFTNFNNSVPSSNKRNDFAYFPEFIDTISGNQWKYDKENNRWIDSESFKSESVKNKANLNFYKNTKGRDDKANIITDFRTYLTEGGDDGITIFSGESLSSQKIETFNGMDISGTYATEKYYSSGYFIGDWDNDTYQLNGFETKITGLTTLTTQQPGFKEGSKEYLRHMLIQGDEKPSIFQNNMVFLQVNDYTSYYVPTKISNTKIKNSEIIYTHDLELSSLPVFYKINIENTGNTKKIETSYANTALQSYIFRKPVNISKFHIRFFDKFNKDIDFGGTNYSLTLQLDILMPDIDLTKELLLFRNQLDHNHMVLNVDYESDDSE